MTFKDFFKFIKPGWKALYIQRQSDNKFKIMNDEQVEHCVECMNMFQDNEVINFSASGNKEIEIFLK